MKQITLICSLLMIFMRSYGQDVNVKNLIPISSSADYNWFSYVHNNVGYGGVVTSENDNWFGKAGSTTYFTASSNDMNFWTQTGDVIFFPTSGYGGNVGIGTTNPLAKLSVNGDIRAEKVKVLADVDVPDYVFEPDYELMTLNEVKSYIALYSHLPEIPSAVEIGENGIDIGDMNMRLLKKIEELTLHQIALMEKLEEQQMRIDELEDKIK